VRKYKVHKKVQHQGMFYTAQYLLEHELLAQQRRKYSPFNAWRCMGRWQRL